MASPWLSDAPVELTAQSDAFGVEGLVDRLALAISEATPPFTLSLSGSWGVGKSTVALAVVARLRQQGVPAVLVDAWTEDVSTLRRTIVVALGAAMRHSTSLSAQAAEREKIAGEIDGETLTSATTASRPKTDASLRDIASAVRANPITFVLTLAAIGFLLYGMLNTKPDDPLGKVYAALLAIGVPFLLFSSGFVFATRGGSETRGPAERNAVLSREFAAFVAGDKGGRHERALVVVDNLDRLPGEDAVRALSEIRSLVEIVGSRCVFLVPVDRSALVGHIKGTLKGDADPRAAAKSYLDKFFNLDLILTEPEPVDIRDWARRQAALVLPDGGSDDFRAAVGIVTRAAGSSPRAVKRILNGVSSRRRLMDTECTASLAQIALVESLLALYPSLLPWMATEPRRLTELRDRVLSAGDATGQDAAIVQANLGSEVDANALREFLVDFRDVELDVATLRLVLSLRPDREWLGVADPSALRPALWAGDAAAFKAALEATPSAEREAAIDRAADRLDASADFFVRDAMAALRAVVEVLPDYPRQATRIRGAGIDAVLRADPGLRGTVTEPIAGFLFAAPNWRVRELGLAFVEALDAAVQGGEPEQGLVTAVRLGSRQLDEQSVARAREALAKCGDDALAGLYLPQPELALLEGPVADSLAARAARVELPTPEPAAATAFGRLAQIRAAGGRPAVGLDAVASRLTTQLSAFPGDLPQEGLEVVALSAAVLRDVPGAEVDAYAATLESRGTQRAAFLDAALVMATRLSSAAREVDNWLGTSAAPDEARGLLEHHADSLSTAGSDWAAVSVKRWISQKDPKWARLVRDFWSQPVAQLAAAPFSATPSADVGARFSEAVDVLEGLEDAPPDLVARAGAWMAGATPVTAIGGMGEGLARLASHGEPLDPVSSAIRRQASTMSSPSDIAALVDAASQLARAGVPPADLAPGELASRAVATGVANPAAARWLARESPDKDTVVKLVADTIRNPVIAVSDAVSLAAAVRRDLDRKSGVAMALAERAAAASTDEGGARALLEEARSWRRQPRAEQATYEGFLSEVARRWHDLDPLVIELKGVGLRRQGPAAS